MIYTICILVMGFVVGKYEKQIKEFVGNFLASKEGKE